MGKWKLKWRFKNRGRLSQQVPVATITYVSATDVGYFYNHSHFKYTLVIKRELDNTSEFGDVWVRHRKDAPQEGEKITQRYNFFGKKHYYWKGIKLCQK